MRTDGHFYLTFMYMTAVLTPLHIVSSDQCPDFGSPAVKFQFKGEHQGTCFILLNQKTKSWYEARDICERNGWRLFQIMTPEKDRFYEEYFFEFSKSMQCTWMGLSDADKEGEWRWADGSPTLYTRVDYDAFHVFTKWKYDCISFCKEIFKFETRWRQSECVDTAVWQILCEKDVDPEATTAIDTTPEQASPPVRTREKRIKTGPIIKRMGTLDGYRLTSPPVKVTREVSSTMCARRCTSPTYCVLYNFHRFSGRCALYSSVEVLEGEKLKESGWEMWIVR